MLFTCESDYMQQMQKYNGTKTPQDGKLIFINGCNMK